MTRLPSIFVSHGAPDWALDPGPAGRRLRALGAVLPRPQAVLVVSPHWTTRGLRVGGSAAPATIHDFHGFDPALYRIHYRAPGHPERAAAARDALRAAGLPAEIDPDNGLDHGAWVPLRHLYPDADVPVFQVSMPAGLQAAGALRIGRALAPLTAQGVLVIGSGSLTHNLAEYFGGRAVDASYVAAFTGWVHEAVRSGDTERLARAMTDAPFASRAHPSDEHFLPLLVAAGAGEPGAPSTIIDGGVPVRALSMDAIVFGAV